MTNEYWVELSDGRVYCVKTWQEVQHHIGGSLNTITGGSVPGLPDTHLSQRHSGPNKAKLWDLVYLQEKLL